MITRYLLLMLILPIVVLTLALITLITSGNLHHVSDMVLGIAIILVVVNLSGALCIVAPVGRYLTDDGDVSIARDRLTRLPLLSGAWAAVLTLTHMYLQYFIHHVQPLPEWSSLGASLIQPASLIALFALSMGLSIFLLVEDYLVRMREYLSRVHGVEWPPGDQRILHKLGLAFVTVSVVPMTLFIFRAFAMDDALALHGLEIAQVLQIDALGSLFLVAVAIVSATRYLTRPIELLLAAVRRVTDGDLASRAPITSDDEIGRLTQRFNQMSEGLREREFIRSAFGKFVPAHIASIVLKERGIVRPVVREGTILFSDIEGFTAISEKLRPDEILAMLNEYFAIAAPPIHEHWGVITQFQGDAILASFNLPVEHSDHAANALRAAQAMQRLFKTKRFFGDFALNTRFGINTGIVVGGMVGGDDRIGYTIHGDSVNVAARLEQLNKLYGSRILLSARTAALAGGEFEFREKGEVSIRGRAKPIRVLELPTDVAT
jgi:class 3 adenylate cyclase